MATWNNSDYDAAVNKAGQEPLSAHEKNKLEEAKRQYGSRGDAAKIALERDKKRFG